MLVEKSLESQIADALGALPALSSAFVMPSRSSAADGSVKGVAPSEAPQIVSVSVGLRQHDDFSLPTVMISGAVVLTTRAELCPTGEEHENAIEAISRLFSHWHLDGEAMSSALSIEGGLFAAGLRMEGGNGKAYDFANSVWTESVSFTIRGTLLGDN